MIALSLVAALMFTTVLSAQTGTGVPSAAPRGGTVRGTVVGAGNEPLRKAEVSLRAAGRGVAGSGPTRMPMMPTMGPGQSAWSHTTDASGTFVFTGVPRGEYLLFVQRNGYVQTDIGSRRATITIAGEEVQTQTVRLTPHSVISGKVTDEDGDPLLHASVQILRETWTGGRKQLMPINGASTDDLGQYRIHGLPPGRYHLLVNYQRGGDASRRGQPGTAETGYAPVYYPGVSDMSQALPLTLAAGQEMRGADLQLRRVPVFRIRGKVLDEDGKPAAQIAVMALPESGWSGVRGTGVVRGADGSFDIGGVAPGSYLLIANKAGREGQRSFARVPAQVGTRDLDGVVLQLQRAFEISGVVKMPEGQTVSGLRVTLEAIDNPGMPNMAGMQQAPVDANGTWKVPSVTPGQYRIHVYGLPEGTYLKAVNAGGHDITDGAQIAAAATGIEVTLAPNAPEVSGTVVNREKQPAGEAIVVLVPDATRRIQTWRYRTTTSDTSGAWAMRGLTPGQYTVLALPKSTEEGVWFSPEFLKTVEGNGAAIKLEEKSRETAVVTLGS